DEWDDLVQEVITAAALALREGRLREPLALVGFLKSTARFKYLDRLRSHLGQRRGERLPWAELVDSRDRTEGGRLGWEAREDLRRARERIPETQRAAVIAVYAAALTYEEAARATGTPLGPLKRQLRDGLAQLRGELGSRFDEL